MPLRTTLLLTMVVFLFANLALAEETTDADRQAKIQFEEGVRLFQEGNFDSAAIAFERAFELRPSYKILYNVGQVEAELKHYFRASEAYRKYLEQGAAEVDSARRKEVSAQIDRLSTLFGFVDIKYSKDGVTVFIDGVRIGTTPILEASPVDMGTHELSLRDGIEEVYRESFRIAGGQRLTLALDNAEPAATPTASAPPPSASPPAPSSEPSTAAATPREKPEASDAGPTPPKKKRKFTWAALGIAAAAGVSGGILGGISMGRESSLTEKCTGSVCDSSLEADAERIQHMSIAADILYGVAGVAAVAAVVLFVVEPKRHAEKSVSWSPALSPTFLGVDGRF